MHSDMSNRYIGLKGNVNYQRGGNGANGEQYALTLFGKSLRSTNCDCDRTNEPSLLQTMFLQNDSEIFRVLDRNDGWLKQIANANRSRGDNAADEVKELTADIKQLESEARKLKKSGKDKEEDLEKVEGRIAKLKRELSRAEKKKDEPAPVVQTPEELVVEAYLRTVGRLPNDRELKTAGAYLAEAEDTASGMKDLLWALLNTKEFIVNR
jgi:chromosome segregation ATPase